MGYSSYPRYCFLQKNYAVVYVRVYERVGEIKLCVRKHHGQ